MTKDAAVYMKVVSPGSIHGPYVPFPGGVKALLQWNSGVVAGFGSLPIGPNCPSTLCSPTAISPDAPTTRPVIMNRNLHLCFSNGIDIIFSDINLLQAIVHWY